MAEISASQYGQQRGISKQRISKAIKDGKLNACVKRNPDGTPFKDPRSGAMMLDPEIADLEWQKNVGLHPNAKHATQLAESLDGGAAPSRDHEARDAVDMDPAGTTPADALAKGKAVAGAYQQNRGTREFYAAETARLDYLERVGELVPVADMQAMAAKLANETKSRILAVPGKAKSQIPHLTTDDTLLLGDLLREALTELADAKFV